MSPDLKIQGQDSGGHNKFRSRIPIKVSTEEQLSLKGPPETHFQIVLRILDFIQKKM